MAVPATRLDADLAELLARAGARTVRVVDGRAGSVVAEAGDAASGPDDPAAVAGLLREAVALGEGGLDDVLVTTDRSLHVLRPAPVAGVFVHLRLDLGADPVRARRALADPALQDAVRRAVAAEPDPVSDLTAPLEVVTPAADVAAVPDASAETVAVPVVAPAPSRPAAPLPAAPLPAAPLPAAPSAIAATFGPAPVLPARVTQAAVGEDGPVLAEPVGGNTPAAPASPGTVGPTASGGGGLFTPVTSAPVAPAAPDPPAEPGAAGAAASEAGAAAPTTSTDPGTGPAPAGPGSTGSAAQALPQPRPADAEPDAPEAGAAEAAPTTRRTRPSTPGQQPALTVLATDRARSGAGARAAVALAELSRPDAPPVVLPRRRSGAAVRSVPAPRSGGSTSGLPDRAWAKDLDTLRRLADGLRRLS